jgi:thymidylate kinase
MNNRENLIIAIEWISGSWKTTISRMIQEKLWLSHVWESFHFLKNWENIPIVDENDAENTLERNHNFLLELEKRKNQFLLWEILLWNDIIMERTVLTLLYTELAIQNLWKYGDYDLLLKKIDKLINSWEIILPDYIFFLKTNPNIAKNRIMNRNWETSDFFSNEDTLTELNNALFTLISDDNFIKKINYEIIENNWLDDIEHIVNLIVEKIRNLKK